MMTEIRTEQKPTLNTENEGEGEKTQKQCATTLENQDCSSQEQDNEPQQGTANKLIGGDPYPLELDDDLRQLYQCSCGKYSHNKVDCPWCRRQTGEEKGGEEETADDSDD